ncbi:efflux RND transporter periplasmic adaptor subunit [Teredinibacter haidensis]|uniref:efflux RND transporter periplasmic adaptor subunit n=1 Tax=Teredinibacter haidensis TaxID=2731755 RepID=UPI000948F53D|nr:biotin/lipoyl-binding protein [Teredinibacter haidensis]
MTIVRSKVRYWWPINRAVLVPIFILLCGVLIASTLLVTAPVPEEQPPKESVWPVSAVVVNLTDANPMAPLFGRVESPREAKIASRLPAEVVAVEVHEGDEVEKGQVLLRLDDADLLLAVQQNQANLLEAEARLKSNRMNAQSDSRLLQHQKILWHLTDKKVARQKSLLEEKIIAQSVYDDSRLESIQQAIELEKQIFLVANANNTEKLAEANVTRALAKLERANLQLSYATVTAPFNGVVSKVLISEGDRLQVGSPTLQIFDREELQVRSAISNAYVSAIKTALTANQTIVASTEAYQHKVELELVNLTSSVSSSGASVDGLFRVTDSGEWLVLGQMLPISLQMPTENAVVLIPPQALYDQDYVYAIENGSLVPLKVEVVGETSLRGKTKLLLRSNDLHDGILLLGSRLANAKTGLKVEPRVKIDYAPILADAENQD